MCARWVKTGSPYVRKPYARTKQTTPASPDGQGQEQKGQENTGAENKDHENKTPVDKSHIRFRRRAAPLADIVSPLLKPAFQRQGFGQSALILNWEDIVGEGMAAFTEPVRLLWPKIPSAAGAGDDPGGGDPAAGSEGTSTKAKPRKKREGATLLLNVTPGLALDIQHMAPVIIERVNTFLGWPCVAKIRAGNGAIPQRLSVRKAKPEPGEASVGWARDQTSIVADPSLQEALVRLGARIHERAHQPKPPALHPLHRFGIS